MDVIDESAMIKNQKNFEKAILLHNYSGIF